ncbi:MAG TPA: hypothetical protein VFX02_11075 [Gammaproteobacteria bacterium]|nr:hypothetical protein [Gammaproteobacteria bacterium]
MFFILGWVKETKPVQQSLLHSYCYHCQKRAGWDLWRETEWVSFFYIKTVPFIWKNYLMCSGCRDIYPLDWRRCLQLSSPQVREAMAAFLEETQLSSKNETQRRFLLSSKAGREAREKSAAQNNFD